MDDLAFYAVRATLPQDGSLPMGVSCEIIVPRESAADVSTVSMSAIQYDDDGEPFVYCFDRNNEIVEQRVELGIIDGSNVEIREGLRSGETVLIPPSFGFAPMAMRERMMGGGKNGKAIIPNQAAMRLSGSNTINSLTVYLSDTDAADEAISDMEDVHDHRHRAHDGDRPAQGAGRKARCHSAAVSD